jgi:hypothetical protein
MNKRKEKENAIKEVWYRNGNTRIYLEETGNEDTKFRKNLIFFKKEPFLLLTSADHVKYGLA